MLDVIEERERRVSLSSQSRIKVLKSLWQLGKAGAAEAFLQFLNTANGDIRLLARLGICRKKEVHDVSLIILETL